MFNQLLQRVWGRSNPANTLKNSSSRPTTSSVLLTEKHTPVSPRRTVKLIRITADNNNKYYEMRENENDTFDVQYGRVGGWQSKATHPIAQWDRKLREKRAKGYIDQTHLFAETSPDTDVATIANPDVRTLMSRLQELAKRSVSQNYAVTAQQVTRKQVETAQQRLNELAALLTAGMDIREYNAKLLDLFTIIPRRMVHVGQYLVNETPQSDTDLQPLHDHLADEQSTLDVMRGQVELALAMSSENQVQPTLLDGLNLTVDPVTDRQILSFIRRMMGADANKFDAAFSVRQAATDATFDTYVRQQKNRKTHLLWYGSRSENWLSILKTGLVLRPANAVITGRLFGHGIYFADQFSKSLNYTSLHGSAWANGQQPEGYLAIYEVHVGNQLELTQHEPQHMRLNADALNRMDTRYDSVFARRGASLQKNEFIIYHPAQCTVRYIVRIKA